MTHHLPDIPPGFRVRWDGIGSFAGAGDGSRPSIVRRKCQRQAVEGFDLDGQIPTPTHDILVGVEWVAQAQVIGGSRHELHEAHGSFWGDRPMVEAGLGLDDRFDKARVKVVALCGVLDDALNVCRGGMGQHGFSPVGARPLELVKPDRERICHHSR